MKGLLNTKEHYELMYQFEKDYPYFQQERESKELWTKGIIYTNGKVNELFKMYRAGYSFGKAVSHV